MLSFIFIPGGHQLPWGGMYADAIFPYVSMKVKGSVPRKCVAEAHSRLGESCVSMINPWKS